MTREEDTSNQESGQKKPVIRRDRVVVTKVTEQEFEQTKSTADLCGMTRSDFIRARALGYKPRQRLSDRELDGLRQLAACRTDMVPNTAKQKSQPVIRQSNPVYEDYTENKSNRLPTEFEHDGKTYKRYLPDKVIDFFNNEFDYQELANWQDLQNLAMAYFTLIASPYEVTSGGGGGGSQSDLKWGATRRKTR